MPMRLRDGLWLAFFALLVVGAGVLLA